MLHSTRFLTFIYTISCETCSANLQPIPTSKSLISRNEPIYLALHKTGGAFGVTCTLCCFYSAWRRYHSQLTANVKLSPFLSSKHAILLQLQHHWSSRSTVHLKDISPLDTHLFESFPWCITVGTLGNIHVHDLLDGYEQPLRACVFLSKMDNLLCIIVVALGVSCWVHLQVSSTSKKYLTAKGRESSDPDFYFLEP